MIDPYPSEEEYSPRKDQQDFKELEELREKIRTIYRVYETLQKSYKKKTGREYQWFK